MPNTPSQSQKTTSLKLGDVIKLTTSDGHLVVSGVVVQLAVWRHKQFALICRIDDSGMGRYLWCRLDRYTVEVLCTGAPSDLRRWVKETGVKGAIGQKVLRAYLHSYLSVLKLAVREQEQLISGNSKIKFSYLKLASAKNWIDTIGIVLDNTNQDKRLETLYTLRTMPYAIRLPSLVQSRGVHQRTKRRELEAVSEEPKKKKVSAILQNPNLYTA
jgi:hypothetical protein